MISDEWLSRYGLLENFNASVTRTRTGTWTTGVTAIALCTSCSRAKKTHTQRYMLNSVLLFFSTNATVYSRPDVPRLVHFLRNTRISSCNLFDVVQDIKTR